MRQTSSLDPKIQLYTYRMGKIQPENNKSHKNSLWTLSSHKLTMKINSETELSWHLRSHHKEHTDQKEGGADYKQATSGIWITTFQPLGHLSAYTFPILVTKARFTGGLGGSFLALLYLVLRKKKRSKEAKGRAGRKPENLFPHHINCVIGLIP